ncbi:hypothetical protein WDW89_11395 [Deltaproteobacteria bacterium TL4]
MAIIFFILGFLALIATISVKNPISPKHMDAQDRLQRRKWEYRIFGGLCLGFGSLFWTLTPPELQLVEIKHGGDSANALNTVDLCFNQNPNWKTKKFRYKLIYQIVTSDESGYTDYDSAPSFGDDVKNKCPDCCYHLKLGPKLNQQDTYVTQEGETLFSEKALRAQIREEGIRKKINAFHFSVEDILEGKHIYHYSCTDGPCLLVFQTVPQKPWLIRQKRKMRTEELNLRREQKPQEGKPQEAEESDYIPSYMR